MDIVMPKLDGFAATSRIMSEAPTAIMVFSTEVDVEGHKVFEALSRGARDVLAKPGSPQAWTDLAGTLPERIRLVAEGYRNRFRTAGPGAAELPAPWETPSRALRYVAVGASTGGPEALRELFLGLAPRPPMAVLVVQHIAREFEEGLADWLAADVAMDIRMARQGEVAEPGTVRLAPQGTHLRLTAEGRLRLDDESPPIRGHRPSADVLLASCAAAAGSQTAGVLLSGMGRDGVAGLEELRRAGGLTLVQDQATSVVFGMPQAALAAGAAELALGPGRLAAYLLACCRAGGDPGGNS
jgi:two-component system chemotaxis response regulator CheB